MEKKKTAMDVLKKVKGKRGYLLPYHELFACIDPILLEKYDDFYTELTLKNKVLDNKTKELAWIGILAAASEEAGTIHLKKGRDAGITDEEISDVITLTQIAKGFDVLMFVEEKWGSFFQNIRVMEIYGNLVKQLKKNVRLSEKIVELVFIGIYAALEIKKGLEFHLMKSKECGARDEEIAEVMSFVILPRGVNTMLEAAEVLKNLVKEGKLKPDSIFKYWLSTEVY
jgi:alkylhydroperoxidase/carboxymuconolactone decarboxylase family protein YurZ